MAAATLVGFLLPGDPLGRSRRTAPSAGALHPISVVVLRPGPLPMRVDPWSGRLQALRPADGAALHRGAERLHEMLPDGEPTFLALLGDLGLVDAAYANPGSLLWRDAGALLATLHLCASALGLGFCPLGALGGEVAAALFPNESRVVACGAAALGVPNTPAPAEQ
ncbi:nitroreductase family protein [Roseicella frigidaeris]|uniref:nitroreductase family protein n=1 Tax=Roseicella frigidaeris TaxID=2230885 RepID=UPI0038D222D5